MKKRIKLFWILTIDLAGSGGMICAEHHQVAFDHLLPMTIYRQAYALCMRSWFGMREFDAHTSDEPAMQDLQDCLLGRLVRMKMAIKKIPSQSRDDHTTYLLMLLQQIEVEQHDYFANDSLAHEVMKKSESHLLRLLQKSMQE